MENYLRLITALWLASVFAGCAEPAAQGDEVPKDEVRVFHGMHTDYGPVFCQGIWIRESEIHCLELTDRKPGWVTVSVRDVDGVLSKVQEAMELQMREGKSIQDRLHNLPDEIETARATNDKESLEALTIEVERLAHDPPYFLHMGKRSGDDQWTWAGGQYRSGDPLRDFLEQIGATWFAFDGQAVHEFVGIKYPFENY